MTWTTNWVRSQRTCHSCQWSAQKIILKCSKLPYLLGFMIDRNASIHSVSVSLGENWKKENPSLAALQNLSILNSTIQNRFLRKIGIHSHKKKKIWRDEKWQRNLVGMVFNKSYLTLWILAYTIKTHTYKPIILRYTSSLSPKMTWIVTLIFNAISVTIKNIGLS